VEREPPVPSAPDDPAPAEIAGAIEELFNDEANLNKLNDYARYLILGIGRAAEHYDADDLLAEAVSRTLGGERKWNRQAVDITGHLIGVMESISSHRAESIAARKIATYTETEVTRRNSDGDEVSLLQQYPSGHPDPERIAAAKQELESIEESFRDDKEVTELLEAMKLGVTSGPEIQSLLEISQQEYDTRMKRLRRRARTLDENRNVRKPRSARHV
jgi:hypothetical protein